MKKIICFDVDGTLFDGISWKFLTKGLGASVEEHMRIYKSALEGRTDFEEAKTQLRDLYLTTGNANRQYIERLFESVELRPETFDVIAWLKKEGFLVFLVSGAPQTFVKAIARKLGVEGVYAASNLLYNEKDNLSALLYTSELERGKQKVIDIHNIAKSHDVSIKNIFFVGDGENDVEVFKETGKGIAVHTSLKLLKDVAWKEIGSLNELMDGILE